MGQIQLDNKSNISPNSGTPLDRYNSNFAEAFKLSALPLDRRNNPEDFAKSIANYMSTLSAYSKLFPIAEGEKAESLFYRKPKASLSLKSGAIVTEETLRKDLANLAKQMLPRVLEDYNNPQEIPPNVKAALFETVTLSMALLNIKAPNTPELRQAYYNKGYEELTNAFNEVKIKTPSTLLIDEPLFSIANEELFEKSRYFSLVAKPQYFLQASNLLPKDKKAFQENLGGILFNILSSPDVAGPKTTFIEQGSGAPPKILMSPLTSVEDIRLRDFSKQVILRFAQTKKFSSKEISEVEQQLFIKVAIQRSNRGSAEGVKLYIQSAKDASKNDSHALKELDALQAELLTKANGLKK